MNGTNHNLLSFYEWLINSMLFWLVLACWEVLIAVTGNSFSPPLGSGSLPSVRDVSFLISALSIYALFSIPSALTLFCGERVFNWISQMRRTGYVCPNRMDLCLLLGWGLLSFKWISNLMAYVAPSGKLPILPYLAIIPFLLCQILLSVLLKKGKGYYRLQWIILVVGSVFFTKRAYEMFIVSGLGLVVKVFLFSLFFTIALLIALTFYNLLQYCLQHRKTPKPGHAMLFLICLVGGWFFTYGTFSARETTLSYESQPLEQPNGVSGNRSNVILILVDCLRADHLGCYGYARDTSPFIDESSRTGVVFNNCIAPSSWTIPSVVSLFTGVYPQQHEVNSKKTAISETLINVHELLEAQGLLTAAFVTNYFLRPDFGYARGFSHFFDHYLKEDFREYVTARLFFFNALLYFSIELLDSSSVDPGWSRWWSFGLPPHNHEKISAQRVTDDVLEWMKAHHERPFYSYIHFMDVHSPYDNRWYPVFDPVSYPQQNLKDKLVNVYDGRIQYVDAQIKRIWECVRQLNLSENTLFIVTADHGEEFFDHEGRGHSHTLYDELIKVPLIMWIPALFRKDYSITYQVQLIDLPVTILDFFDIEVPDQMRGRSLLALMADPPVEGESSYALSHTSVGRKSFVSSQERELWKKETGSDKVILESLRIDNQWKIISGDDGNTRLFNLQEDKQEQHNLSTREQLKLRELKSKLSEEQAQWKQATPSQEKTPLSPDISNKLKALGYL